MLPGDDPANENAVRRMKKREHDRRAQRAARERTKNRIAELEAAVAALSQSGPTNYNADLLERIATVSKERDDLAGILNQISVSMKKYSGIDTKREHSSNKGHQADTPASRDQQSRDLSEEFLNFSTLPSISYDAEDNNLIFSPGEDGKTNTHGPCWSEQDGEQQRTSTASTITREPQLALQRLQDLAVEDMPRDESQELILPPSEGLCDCAMDHPPITGKRHNIWRAANAVLKGTGSLSEEVLKFEDTTSEHIAIRAVLEGWDTVNETTQLSPLWSKLKLIDELQFSSCPPVERLAILMTMHLLLRYHADQTVEQCAKLPSWLHQRPSQAVIPHSYAINFFVWPGLRERFIFSQHQYCSNEFWYYFANNFRMAWPFELRDCYHYNLESRNYSISAEFHNRMMDLNAWRMTPDFFVRFPELYSDIPSVQSVPPSLELRSGDQLRERRDDVSRRDGQVRQSRDPLQLWDHPYWTPDTELMGG